MFKSRKMQIKALLITTWVVLGTCAMAESTYKVRVTDNLSKIVKAHYKDSEFKKSQLMIGVLAANPDAFQRGNINALKSNQSLTLPDLVDLKIMDQNQASKLIVKHSKHFRNRSKKQLTSPFENYNSKADRKMTLSRIQQEKLIELKKLEAERTELLARMEKLIEDNQQTDMQLQEFNTE